MDYKYTLKKIECDLFNCFYKNYEEVLTEFIEVFEPFARFKVLNKNRIEELNNIFKEKQSIVKYITFRYRPYFNDQKELKIWFDEDQKYLLRGEIHTEIKRSSVDLRMCELNCTGSDIKACAEEQLDNVRLPEDRTELCDYEAFYAELEALCDKHKCAERGLTYLITRN